jgi:23S rRNA (cytosine1962-C5)-methyltransferase
MRNYAKIKISKKGTLREENFHPWIFDNEIEEVIGTYKNGDIVDVFNYKDKYIGNGYTNDNSKNRV